MTTLKLLKIKILTSIIRKIEPSKTEYIEYERDIRQSKLDVPIGYNAALGFVVLSRALRTTIGYFIVFMVRVLIIVAVISIITISYS